MFPPASNMHVLFVRVLVYVCLFFLGGGGGGGGEEGKGIARISICRFCILLIVCVTVCLFRHLFFALNTPDP